MRALLVVSVVVLLAACDEGVAPAPMSWNGITPPANTLPPPLVGSADVAYAPEGARGLEEVSAVDVRLRVSGIAGVVSVDAEFLAPGPAAYERHTRRVEAVPTEEKELVFSLPVAGTHIPVHGLAGTWQVRFFANGAPLTTTTFTLER